MHNQKSSHTCWKSISPSEHLNNQIRLRFHETQTRLTDPTAVNSGISYGHCFAYSFDSLYYNEGSLENVAVQFGKFEFVEACWK